MSDSFDDMIPHLPDSVREELFGIKAQISQFRGQVAKTFVSLAQLPDRRAFAAEALKHAYSSMLFWRYSGVEMDECFQRLHPDRLVDWLKLSPGAAEAGE